MEEIWKDIDGYEGLYQVSNIGRVRSLKFGKIKVLKQEIIKKGYKRVHLLKNRKMKGYLVHRLVAEAFIPNNNNLPCVNHKDEDKTNNRIENLEWCDIKYNANYGTAIQRSSKTRINHPSMSKPVIQYTKSGYFITEYKSTKEAQRHTGISHKNISSCCNNKQHHKSAGGYVWRFKEKSES